MENIAVDAPVFVVIRNLKLLNKYLCKKLEASKTWKHSYEDVMNRRFGGSQNSDRRK